MPSTGKLPRRAKQAVFETLNLFKPFPFDFLGFFVLICKGLDLKLINKSWNDKG